VEYASKEPKSGSLQRVCNEEQMWNVEKLADVRVLKKDGERERREVNKTSVNSLLTRKVRCSRLSCFVAGKEVAPERHMKQHDLAVSM
jgi:hypothetical protein